MSSFDIRSIGSHDRWGFGRRSARGQAIAEGAAIMPVIIMVSVFMIMLLVYAGTTLYFMVKLGFVANQVANYAANHMTGDPTRDTATLSTLGLGDMAQSMAKNVGLPPLDGATVTPTGNEVLAKLTLSNISLFNGTIPTFSLVQVGDAFIDDTKPHYYCAIEVGQPFGSQAATGGGPVAAAIPCYQMNGYDPTTGAGPEYGGPGKMPNLPQIGWMNVIGPNSHGVIHSPDRDYYTDKGSQNLGRAESGMPGT